MQLAAVVFGFEQATPALLAEVVALIDAALFDLRAQRIEEEQR